MPWNQGEKGNGGVMRKHAPFALTEQSGPDGGPTATLGLDRYPALAEAGTILGMSGPALRKKFDRGDLPRKFILRVGPRTLRVDIVGLVKFLKGQANQMSA
jgi:hypothetical protein